MTFIPLNKLFLRNIYKYNNYGASFGRATFNELREIRTLLMALDGTHSNRIYEKDVL
jgi:hypothetical protein